MPTTTITARFALSDHDVTARSGVDVFWSLVRLAVDVAGGGDDEATVTERTRIIETDASGHSDFTVPVGSTVRLSCPEAALPEMEYTAPSAGTVWYPVPGLTDPA